MTLTRAVTLNLVGFLLAASAEGDGRLLFLQMQNAIGGATRISAVRDFEQFERADTWFPDGRPRGEVRKRVRFIRPAYLRIDQVGPGDTYVLYFDGKTGWEIMPDGKVTDLAGGELRFAEGYLGGISINRWLLNQNPDVAFTSSSPNTITITNKGDPKHQTVITVDPATHLEVKSTGISLADPDHPIASETRLENWHAVDGLKFPGRIINIHGGAKLADIAVQYTRLNAALQVADLARKPADYKPVMSGK